MDIIVPAAGLSTRFPGTRPKYLLYSYDGVLMLKKALEPFLGKHRITVGILKKHNDMHDAKAIIEREFADNINVVILNNLTRGPADTVYQILKTIDNDMPFLVKDCDNFYHLEPSEGNAVYTSNIKDYDVLRKMHSKSFCIVNDQGVIHDVVEKEIVSNHFCVGAYQFNSSKEYMIHYENVQSAMKDEIYVSHVITCMIQSRKVFLNKGVYNFIDVGTLEDWNAYNDKPTIFCDIDGTLVKSMNRPYKGGYEILENNYKIIKSEYERGCQIVFTTARPIASYSNTRKMLDELGFKNCELIMGLNNARRILINDFGPTNIYPSAIAYNIKRDGDNLNEQYRI